MIVGQFRFLLLQEISLHSFHRRVLKIYCSSLHTAWGFSTNCLYNREEDTLMKGYCVRRTSPASFLRSSSAGHSSDLRITCNDQYILTHDLSPEQVSPEQPSDFSFFVAKIRHFAKTKKSQATWSREIFGIFFLKAIIFR